MDAQEHRIQESPVCAWCHCEYDSDTGARGCYLPDAEYGRVKSHGICRECAALEKAKFENSLITASRPSAQNLYCRVLSQETPELPQ